MSTESGPSIPDLTETIKVYRHWIIAGNDLLPPIHPGRGYSWRPGESHAYCGVLGGASDLCKSFACGCGFYGVYSPRHAYARETEYRPQTIVFGVFEAYGRVRLGTEGLRATKAKVIALHMPPTDPFGLIGPRRQMASFMETWGNSGVKFYRHRSNLIKAMKVEKPKALIDDRATYQFG